MKSLANLWKIAIHYFWDRFMEFYAPDIYAQIDWNTEVEFLESELQAFFPDSMATEGRVDTLAKVRLLSGDVVWLLVHIEIQGYYDADFAERMFRYHIRIAEKYPDIPLESLAVITEPIRKLRPNVYEKVSGETRLRFEYRVCQLAQYHEADLLANPNPFALVMASGLAAMQAGDDVAMKERFRRQLLRLLSERGYSREEISTLFAFLSRILYLGRDLELEIRTEFMNQHWKTGPGRVSLKDIPEFLDLFEEDIQELKDENLQKGITEGLQKGKLEGKLEIALQMLSEGIPMTQVVKITGLPEAQIREFQHRNRS